MNLLIYGAQDSLPPNELRQRVMMKILSLLARDHLLSRGRRQRSTAVVHRKTYIRHLKNHRRSIIKQPIFACPTLMPCVRKVKRLWINWVKQAKKQIVDQNETEQSNVGFKVPPMHSQRSQRAARRSSRGDSTSPGGGPAKTFIQPKVAAPNELTPVKKFVQPLQVSANTTTSPSPKTQNSFRAPLKCEDYNELGTADMQGLLGQVKEENDVPLKIRNSGSSITESSLPSALRDRASSSSISSAPSSPGGVEEAFSISSANGREPPSAVCPVCKEPVDFEFLEEFDGGKRLRSRDQLRFCKAHRARSARSEWSAKGFPEIDWQRFDERMKRYHPVIDDILKGTKSSYYRNALEQQIRSKKFRTMKEAYQDSESMEGLSPGYYGSKGARAMYVFSRFLCCPFHDFHLISFQPAALHFNADLQYLGSRT